MKRNNEKILAICLNSGKFLIVTITGLSLIKLSEITNDPIISFCFFITAIITLFSAVLID